RSSDVDHAVLERLAEDLQYIPSELGELIEEEDAMVGEGELSRAPEWASADEPRVRHGVMGRSERSLGQQRSRATEEPVDGVDLARLRALVEGHQREEAGGRSGEHRLAASRRAAEEDVVSAGGGELERHLDVVLAAHLGHVQLADGTFLLSELPPERWNR